MTRGPPIKVEMSCIPLTYGWMDGWIPEIETETLGIRFKGLAQCQRALLYRTVSVVKDKVEKSSF